MKKVLTVFGTLFLSFGVLTACGEVDEISTSDEEKAKPKTEEKTEVKKEEKKEDIWTYYNDATWEEDYKGLKAKIQKVVVSDEAPRINDNGEEVKSSAVGVKFQIENTTDGKFSTYPDQATLVTSTGEQVEADMSVSDNLGGEIDKGVVKEGDVIFYLERGAAEEITWVKLSWNAREGAEDDFSYDEMKDYEVELKLK